MHVRRTGHPTGRPCKQMEKSGICPQRTWNLVEELEQIQKRISHYPNVYDEVINEIMDGRAKVWSWEESLTSFIS